MAAKKLIGKVAVVTGGGSGIGKAVCELFAKHGASIAVVDRDGGSAAKTVESLPSSDIHHFSYCADISSHKEVQELVTKIGENHNTAPSVLVNSAGITRDEFLLKMDEQMFDDVIAVNLKGTFLMTQAICRAMAQAQIKDGAVVNISSLAGKSGNMGQCNYSASKAGVEGFTRSAAKELAKLGIRCNAVLPGFIETPMTAAVPQKVIDLFRGSIPLRRLGQPEDIADACLFLASNQSSYITGASIDVTGGMLM